MNNPQKTFYELLKLHSEPEKHHAWIGQVVFALAYAQRNFAFTHNDLHGNNIMFQSTTKEYFYYMHNSIKYKVPTYGYLIKIIDFDRGRLVRPGHPSLKQNMARLKRSFLKEASRNSPFYWQDRQWSKLIESYEKTMAS